MKDKNILLTTIRGWEKPSSNSIRSYARWNQKEINDLVNKVKNGSTLKHISTKHFRSEHAILAKLTKICKDSYSLLSPNDKTFINEYINNNSYNGIRLKYSNYQAWWSTTDIKYLSSCINNLNSYTIEDICKNLGRSPAGLLYITYNIDIHMYIHMYKISYSNLHLFRKHLRKHLKTK